jgi:hypothetical protein
MKYYFDNCDLNKFDTIWYGFLKFNNNDDNFSDENNNNISDIILEITECNIYVGISKEEQKEQEQKEKEQTIYLSVDNDGNYYSTDRFEKDIRPIISKMCEVFNTKFINGEFTAIECKPYGVQYKYRLFNDEENNKYAIKKRVLNWTS